MKRIAAVLISVILIFTVFLTVGCNGGGGENNGSKLFVDLHTLMPTPSETATPDQPNPVNASRNIAKKYKETTGVEIVWASDYAKPTDNINNMRAWFNTQINVRNCPAIGFSFGTKMQEDGLYIALDEYLERPNHYVEGNTRWKDLFEDWVWKDSAVLDANGKIVSIPIVLNPGSATAIYYNKDMFTENGITVPTTWKELLNTIDRVKSNVAGIRYPYVPYTGDVGISLSSWVFEFNLAPGFAAHMATKTDYDNDGKVSTNELIRAVLENKFNPVFCQEAKELYSLAWNYYKTVLPTGWESITSSTYLNMWNSHKAAMKNQGLWYYNIERGNTLRDFAFDLFVPPVAQSDSSANASNLTSKTINDGYQSEVLMAFNIMKPAVENNQELLERAIDFLMYLTAPDAITAMVQENGAGLPAVKGAGYPSVYDDAGWLEKSFTEISVSKWPLGFIVSNTANINAAFSSWVRGEITQQEFFTKVNNEQKEGARTMVKNMNIDTTGWNI